MERPTASEYADYFEQYLSQTGEGEVFTLLREQAREMKSLLAGISEEKAGYRYEPGKWSLKQVIGHLIDSERIFAYRALAFARGDRQPLPGFEQDDYVDNGHFDERSMQELARDFATARDSSIALIESLHPSVHAARGVADGKPLSARAIAWLMVGHVNHHTKVLRERYL